MGRHSAGGALSRSSPAAEKYVAANFGTHFKRAGTSTLRRFGRLAIGSHGNVGQGQVSVVSLPRFEPASGEIGAGLPRARPQTRSCVTYTEAPGSRPLRLVEFEV